jgi:hypothetical protein
MAQVEPQMMANMVQIIDVCTKRGAFEGQELAGVATVRQFLIEKIQEDQPAQDPVGQSVADLPAEATEQ